MADLRDTDKLAQAAQEADGVIHTAFIHDFSNFAEVVQIERNVIAAFVSALSGSGKPFVATSGTGVIGDTGERIVDDTEKVSSEDIFLTVRAKAEQDIHSAAKHNIRSSILRLPVFVYGRGGSTFIPFLIKDAREAGVARYVEPGNNKYSVVHVDDVAELYVLALEKGTAGSVYHAVSESGITVKAIAQATANLLGCEAQGISKDEAKKLWGKELATFFSINNQISSSKAEKELGWKPQVTSKILEDIEHGSYRNLRDK
ncbi:NAD-dependent epimerase/dehydratase family protein [Iningainema sp. BLCCT55]|uniref:NAD-dependent epimerase/dehydratase family protein n=1 Tax=Iningainema tapete BLCC-T55 TaxID=2748662 RepID=A0A8J7CF93_9CYAN|nr:NAD-dependent epimerase/dehydratase family protein [Iningainema tapete BLCC-T55]